MKKQTLLLLALCCSLWAGAQTKKDSLIIYSRNGYWASFRRVTPSFQELEISDNHTPVLIQSIYNTGDTILEVRDSLKAINISLQYWLIDIKDLDSIRNVKWMEDDILAQININGFISDKYTFYKNVLTYLIAKKAIPGKIKFLKKLMHDYQKKHK